MPFTLPVKHAISCSAKMVQATALFQLRRLDYLERADMLISRMCELWTQSR